MAAKWSMPKGLTIAELRDFLDEKRGEFDDMSERWQEGDRGTAVSEWLDEIETVCDDYDNAVTAFDELPREVTS